MKSLQGLENIKALDFLEIEYNLQPTSLSGLDSLTSISRGMWI